MDQDHVSERNTSNATGAKGRLYVVATPIGNLGDVSHRAVQTLEQADLIACEDTRHTAGLCRHLGIKTPLTSYYREKEQEKAEYLLAQLLNGKDIALVSDAGTPAISDPGAVLVAKARAAGVKVLAIPGPSALTAALSLSGRQDTSFLFGGFLPAKTGERRKTLRSLATLPHTLVFYEAPHRIRACLADMEEILGDRPALLFRELSKIHEECREGSLAELRKGLDSGEIKGELVLLVEGAVAKAPDKPDNLDELLCWYRDQGFSVKDAARAMATDLDLPRSRVYQRALELWRQA